MKNSKKLTILILITFFLGLLYVITNKPTSILESFSQRECPNILIQKENFIFLYNSRLAKIPGVNPIRFDNLDQYVQFTNWQRSQNIDCPVLFLQHSYDIQGNSVYKKRPSPTNLQGGLPPAESAEFSKLMNATRNNPPFNNDQYPGFDPDNQYQGLTTPLDKIYHENNNGISPNPMDSNWGGTEYTQSLIDKGYYKDNEVKIQVA